MEKTGISKVYVVLLIVIVCAVIIGGVVYYFYSPVQKQIEPVVVGFIGDLETDYGKGSLRGVEIAIEEYNEKGGVLGGRPLKLVTVDSHQDVHEGIKAFEYLVTNAKADLIIDGCMDDVTLGFLPRVAIYQVPTLSTWTSAIVAIEKVREEPDKYKSYFMLNLNDIYIGDQMTRYIHDIFVKEMGWKTCVILNEDTSFGNGVADFVENEAAPKAGIKVVGRIIYDIRTRDFTPIFDRVEASGADFVWQISAANPIPITVQYVESQVSVPFVGINAAAESPEFWDDTGGLVGGVSCITNGITFPVRLDPENQKFYDKYVQKYKTRPSKPLFNSYHAYWGLKAMIEAAERAGGFKPLDAWVKEMEKTRMVFEKDGKPYIVIEFWGIGEVDPHFDMSFPHAAKYDVEDLNGEIVQGIIGTAIQWHADGTAVVTWPPRFATGRFSLPPWISGGK